MDFREYVADFLRKHPVEAFVTSVSATAGTAIGTVYGHPVLGFLAGLAAPRVLSGFYEISHAIGEFGEEYDTNM